MEATEEDMGARLGASRLPRLIHPEPLLPTHLLRRLDIPHIQPPIQLPATPPTLPQDILHSHIPLASTPTQLASPTTQLALLATLTIHTRAAVW